MKRSAPTFNQLNLVVQDMDATLRFYRELGLTIRDTDPSWARHHRTAVMPDGLGLDFDSVEFARKWNKGLTESRGGMRGWMGVLGFGVDSRGAVDEIYARVTGAGYKGQQPPYDAFWGARYAIVEDPDGNAVGLMSPSDDAHRVAITSYENT